MKTALSRVVFGLGLALLVGGWGLKQHTEQVAQAEYAAPSQKMTIISLGAMSGGAFLAGIAWPRDRTRRNQNE